MNAIFSPVAGVVPTRGIDHVAFNVPDLGEAVEFFTVTLGCRLIDTGGPIAHSDDLVVTYAMIHCDPGMVFELLEWRGPDVDPTIPRFSDTGGGHVAFAVDDLEAASTAVATLPNLAYSPPQELPDGRRSMRFTTSWGLTIQLLSPKTEASVGA